MITYNQTTINPSPTIVLEAGEDISNSYAKAVMITDGKAVVATEGVNAIGIILLTEEQEIKKGDSFTVQIKEIGLWRAGEAIPYGTEVACGNNGLAVVAKTGNFITGVALGEAEGEGEYIPVQIIKAGYKA